MKIAKVVAACGAALGMIAGAGWGASEFMRGYIDKHAAEVVHEKLEHGMLIAGTQLQFVQDTQIAALQARIERLREIQRKRPLRESEKDDLQFFRKELEKAKQMRRVK